MCLEALLLSTGISLSDKIPQSSTGYGKCGVTRIGLSKRSG